MSGSIAGKELTLTDQSQIPQDAQSVPPAADPHQPQQSLEDLMGTAPVGETGPSFDGTQAQGEETHFEIDPREYETLKERASQLEQQQQAVFQAARRIDEARRQQAMAAAEQRLQQEEAALEAWAMDQEDPKAALHQVRNYYRNQNQQILGMAQMFVQHQAQQQYLQEVLGHYGDELTDEDKQYLATIDPNAVPNIAENLRARNRREREMAQKIQNLESRNQAQQVMQSGAHRMGGIGTVMTNRGELPSHIQKGTKEHLAWELGLL
jgi:hypothetical protein